MLSIRFISSFFGKVALKSEAVSPTQPVPKRKITFLAGFSSVIPLRLSNSSMVTAFKFAGVIRLVFPGVGLEGLRVLWAMEGIMPDRKSARKKTDFFNMIILRLYRSNIIAQKSLTLQP
jgi:hypothetical protein